VAARLALGALWLSIGGCAIGPNYARPDAAPPAEFRGAEAPLDARSFAELPWWDVFQDQALVRLIEQALLDNYDLRIAATRVEQARYAVGVTRADLLPQLGYDGSAERGKRFVGNDRNVTGNVFLGALQMAWEIDIWGRIRRATEASLADLFAAEDVRHGVVLTLVSDVAQGYLELRELDLELAIALRTRDAFARTLELFDRQFRGGVGNKLETARAAAALANTAAAIPDLERQIVAKENQLSVLLGRSPGAIERGAVLTEQSYPPEVPAGLPAALLERRPDILQAEQNIVAANALVGVAIASFLPRIGLTSLYGVQSPELGDILEGPANVWSIGAALSGPLFQGGRLYYNYKGSVAFWEEAKLAYDATVLNALGEVSNALVARQKFAAAAAELERQVTALQDAVRLATVRYTGGLANYFEVLEAQQQLFPAELALARAQLGELASVVQLYRALGGGWRSEEAAHPERYPLRREWLDAIVPAEGRRAATAPGDHS
jgi:multidrug efflux system outer membrane protein